MESFSNREPKRLSFASMAGVLGLASLLSGDTVNKSTQPVFDMSAMLNSVDEFVINTPEKLLEELKSVSSGGWRLAPVDALYPKLVPQLTAAQRRLNISDYLNNPDLTKEEPPGVDEWANYRVEMQTNRNNWWLQYDHVEKREISSFRNDSFFNDGVSKLCYREGVTRVDRLEGEDQLGENGVGLITFLSLAKPSRFSNDIEMISDVPPVTVDVESKNEQEALLLALEQVRKSASFQQLIEKTSLPTGTEQVSEQPRIKDSVTDAEGRKTTFEVRTVSLQFCMVNIKVEPIPGVSNQYKFTGYLGEVVPR